MFYLALAALKLQAYALSWLPRPFFLFLGRRLGAFLALVKFRSAIVEENLARAFPEKSAREREALARAQYQEFGILLLEIFRSFYRYADFVERNTEVRDVHHLQEALAQGQGVFVMTAHLGNWEVLTASGPALFGTGVTMVTKELKPKWLHRVAEVTRSLVGVRMACEPRTMPSILRALKQKEIVGFVMDQFTGAPFGARVPFFGVPVGSQIALATLALRTRSPVVPALAVRQANGKYLIRFYPPLPLVEDEDLEQAILKNTANYVRFVEGWVREFPTQWLWVHRRWKGDLSPLPLPTFGEMLK